MSKTDCLNLLHIHKVFEAQAVRTPDAVAVIFQNEMLTYRELDHLANNLAHKLQSFELNADALVGLCLPQSVEIVVGLLGILKAGNAVVFLDPTLPSERLAFMIADTEITVMVTNQVLSTTLAAPAVYLVDVAEVKTVQMGGMPTQPTAQSAAPGDAVSALAFCLYTSGTTGQPKGVLIEHAPLVRHCRQLADYYQLQVTDRVLQFAPIAHVAGLEPLLVALLTGACVVLREDNLWSAAEFPAKINQYGLTIVDLPAAYCQVLLETWLKTPDQIHQTSLRIIIVGGDVTLPVVVQWWQQAGLPAIRFLNVYGMTEAVGTVTIYEIPIQSSDGYTVSTSSQRVPVGKPLTGRTAIILDEVVPSERPQPGGTGELCIAGNLARGYLNQPELTAVKFPTDPLCQGSDARVYKTGDLARYLPDGNIELLGRVDHQVQLRGYRIELSEIEAALKQHPDIQDATVIVHGEQTRKQLIAYIVSAPGKLVTHTQNFLDVPEKYRSAAGVLTDPIKRLEFKLKQVNLRSDSQSNRRTISDVQLNKPECNEDFTRAYFARQSYRAFKNKQISFANFSAFLSCLLQLQLENVPLPKYRYPSAGGLYPIQTYLSIKPDAIEGIAEGVYYYHPVEHRLVLLRAGPGIEQTLYPTQSEQQLYTQSAFALFCIVHMDAIVPMYGRELAWELSLLEAGYIGQLLMTEAANHEIGLCPIASVGKNTAEVQTRLGLENNQIPVHSFLGGSIDPSQTRQWLQPAPSSQTATAWKQKIHQDISLRLPSYMLPTRYVLLDTLPRTPSGKVDRQALPTPDTTMLDAPLVAPDNEVEQNLAAIVQEVLGLEQVSVTRNLQELGANSISILNIHKKLNGVFSKDIAVSDIFQYGTVRALARYISEDDLPAVAQQQGQKRGSARRAVRRPARRRTR